MCVCMWAGVYVWSTIVNTTDFLLEYIFIYNVATLASQVK